jgi:ribonuclease P protein component
LNHCFPKKARLLGSKDYQRVYNDGSRKAGRRLQFFYGPNGLARTRFGISVNKRFGDAVDRNALKRKLREAIRASNDAWPPGWDIILHPRSGLKPEQLGILKELKEFLSFLGVQKKLGIP